MAKRNEEIVGRIAVLVNHPFNQYHETKKGQFYLFECINDQVVADALFEEAFSWCRQRELIELVGPKGLSAFDGYGILVDGVEHRQMMIMMNYNFDYYPTLMENAGFEKEVDFVSCYVKANDFIIPEKVKEVSRRVRERGKFKVLTFRNKRQMIRDWSDKSVKPIMILL